MLTPKYLIWFVKETNVVLDNGQSITCYKLDYHEDDKVIDDWALHIRRHYISDDELSESCSELGLTPEKYLKQFVIPQKGESRLSGTSRSNVISEIIFSDLLEFIYGLEVPTRCRINNMSGKTVSEHGTDVIGYKFFNPDKNPDKRDYLITLEVKSELTSKDASVIEKAVTGSVVDEYRVSLSLDYLRKKLKKMDKFEEAKEVLRFQLKTENDYILECNAAGISSLNEIPFGCIGDNKYKIIPKIIGNELRLKGNIGIYYIHGDRLMDLAHKIFDRCIR